MYNLISVSNKLVLINFLHLSTQKHIIKLGTFYIIFNEKNKDFSLHYHIKIINCQNNLKA